MPHRKVYQEQHHQTAWDLSEEKKKSIRSELHRTAQNCDLENLKTLEGGQFLGVNCCYMKPIYNGEQKRKTHRRAGLVEGCDGEGEGPGEVPKMAVAGM